LLRGIDVGAGAGANASVSDCACFCPPVPEYLVTDQCARRVKLMPGKGRPSGEESRGYRTQIRPLMNEALLLGAGDSSRGRGRRGRGGGSDGQLLRVKSSPVESSRVKSRQTTKPKTTNA